VTPQKDAKRVRELAEQNFAVLAFWGVRLYKGLSPDWNPSCGAIEAETEKKLRDRAEKTAASLKQFCTSS
jgi:hypothetical protein